MWNDPAWAFGIAFIIAAFSLRRALPRLLNSIADRNGAHLQVEGSVSAEEVDELRHRLAELEERVDFAERMLTKQQEPAALRPANN
ncbi:MAG: hypothetical protein WBC97_08275 [Gemmatimonadales bacterium]